MTAASPGEPANQEFWYRQKVVERIWAYQRKNKLAPEALYNRSEYDSKDFEMLRSAKLFFGSWVNALNAAGLGVNGTDNFNNKPDSLSPPKRNIEPPTKSQMLDIVRGLAEAGEDMSPENIVIMHNDIWRTACGKNGYFSHWPTVLRKAGIDLSSIATEPYWTEARLNDRILDLYESQLIATTAYIRENFWYLYRFALRLYGSWQWAVNATGLGYDTIAAEYAETSNRQLKLQNNLFKILKRLGRPIQKLNTSRRDEQLSHTPLGLFARDGSSGSVIGTVMRSWWPGLEQMLAPVLASRSYKQIELYYLQGEPREWQTGKVRFIAVSDLISPSLDAGTDEYMKEILTLQYHVPSFL